MEEEDFSKLSIEDRCAHKSWKARVSGYEDVAKLFRTIDDEKSPEWNKYHGMVKKFVVDSNVPAQEKGLDAVLLFVGNCGTAGKTASDVVSGLVQKCIAAPKAKIKELANQICLMYIEIEKQDVVLEELLKGTEVKNPKISAASVLLITEALREFGPKVINPGKLIKRAIALLEDRDKTVRDAAKQLLVEIYRWLGPALNSQLGSLKTAQQTEMTEAFKQIEGRAVPTRLLRSQQAVQAQVARNEEDGGDECDDGGGAEEGEIDPLDLLEPVDILSQLPKNFYTLLESKAWVERKEALEPLEKSLNEAPKLDNADYSVLIKALKKIVLKDSNIVVVCFAIRCISGIAKGLKRKFHQYAAVTLQALFEKFKEKKPNVVTALRDAADNVYISTTIEQISEDVILNLDNKNPNVKAEVAGFLARCFSKCTPAILSKNVLKPLAKALLKPLADQDPNVRENVAMALGTAMKVVGEKSMAQYLTEVDNQKMAKIKECFDKAVITAKPTKPLKVNKEAAKSSPPLEKPQQGAKVVKPKMGATIVKKKAPKTGGLALEDALTKAKDILPEDVMSKLDFGDVAFWEDFLKAIQLAETAGLGEIVFAITCAPSQENGVDILAIKLEAMKFATTLSPVSKQTIENAIPIVTSGMAIKDCSEMAHDIMSAFSSMLSVDAVARAALTNDQVLSNPSSYAAALNWITTSIMKHGEAMDHAFLEDCGKNALSQCDQVRNAGLALIGIMHLPGRGGPSSGESSSSRPEKPVKSSSTSKVNETLKAAEKISDDTFEKENKPSNEPRVDIGNLISSEQMLKDLADKNWKVKAEAVAKVQAIVSASPSITGNLGEVPPLIAARMTDSNMKIAASAIGLVESLAKAMGPAGKQHVKVFLPPLLKSIGDPKVWIRTPAISCVNALGEACGYREFFENEIIADALKSGSPATRAELWTWLSEKLPNIKMISKDELLACLPTLYNNLEDRTAEVRKAANDAVLGFMIHLGFNAMNSACETILKGSSAATIKAILDKTRGLLPEKPLAKSKTQPSLDKGSAKSATAKMAPGSSATITKSTKAKPGSAPAARAGARKKEEDVDTGPMLKVNSLKNQRSIDDQKSKTIKWNFTTPRSEFVELLRDQMTTAGFNKNLIANMFHVDFKYHLKAIDSLYEELPINLPGLLSNLDLVLRWMTLRFFDTNPSVISRGLDYLANAFNALQNEGYTMLEFEASAFIPYLILKSGDPKDVVQAKVKELFEQLKLIYPVGKLVMYLMDGTKSKNARQRAACLDVLNVYMDQYGGSVCQPSLNAVVKDIVKHFGDRDSTVRQSVFRVAVSIYSHEGERFFQILNQFAEKDGQLLEERIRKSAKNRPVASVKPMSIRSEEPEEPSEPEEEYQEDHHERTPPYHSPASVNSTPPQSNTTINVKSPSMIDRHVAALTPRNRNIQHTSYLPTTSSYVSTFNFDEHVIEDLESEQPVLAVSPPKVADIDMKFLAEGSVQAAIKPIQMPRMTPTLSNFTQPTAIKYEINQIASTDIEKAMQSMTQIDTVLNSDKRNTLIPFVDLLVAQLALQLVTLNQSFHPEVVNCYRENFTLLTKICSDPDLCSAIDEQFLHKVLDQVLSLLAESKQETIDRQEMFKRVLNNIVLKLLENANKTSLICALITMLGESMGKPSNVGHYHDLCIRCLWKLIRAQPKWDRELNYNRLLLVYQKFLKDYPSSWWRTQEVDVPLRTVKTMLHTMVKLRGTEVRDIINNDDQLAVETELSLYVKKLVRHLKMEENKEWNKSHGEAGDRSKTDKPASSVSHRMIKEQTNELSEIFKLIGDPNETDEGLKKLYAFKNAHPEADIQPFLVKASSVFQDYIKRGLQDLEAQNYQNTNRQLHSNTFNLSGRADGVSNESCVSSENKYTAEAERLRNRLSQLQEKAGCNESKQMEKADVPRDNKHIKVEKTQLNDDVELIRERLERCKSRAYKS